MKSLVQGDTSRCAKPHVDKSSILACFGLAWPGKSGTFVLKSKEGFAQRNVSPCIISRGRERRSALSSYLAGNADPLGEQRASVVQLVVDVNKDAC